jgi:hypothetical protein
MLRRETLWNACGFLALATLGALGLGGAASLPDGIRLGLPSLFGLGLVAAVLALLFWRGTNAAVCAPFLVLPLLLASGLPVPGLRALSGGPLLALFAAGIAAMLSRDPPRFAPRAFFPVITVVYLCAAARVQTRVGPEGDEPHYLMVADSLLRDHDLDLTQDYAEGRYRAFHPAPLEPHYRVRGRHGEIYSLHAIGLSLLILPAYALGGYPAASFFMALLAALLARELRALVLAFTGREGLALGVAWAVALSPPLIHYAGLIFSEIPAALLVAYGLRRARALGGSGASSALGWGAAMALLPWLNVRYALFPAILLVYAFSERPRPRTLVAALAPLLLSALAVAVYHRVLYGFFDPRLVYGRKPEFALGTLVEGLPGLLLDQEFGLLVYAPLFALAALGLGRLLGGARRDGAVAAALLSLVLLTAGSWDMWRGGFNPPARFLVPVVPVLALAVAAALARGLSSAATLLVGWSLWCGLAGAADPSLVHRDRDGSAPFFRAHSGAEEWTRLLPSYVLADPDRRRLSGVWLAALVAAVAASASRPTAGGLLATTFALLAAAGTASQLSHAASGARDAARLAGIPALEVPGWRVSTAARWGPERLDWGPLYEPHRHADGAVLGDRLRLAAGEYLVSIDVDPSLPVAGSPQLEVRPEARDSAARAAPLDRTASGWTGVFAVRPGEQTGLRLALRGGPAFLLKAIALDRSTFSRPAGLKP